jgi:hypothetical protein
MHGTRLENLSGVTMTDEEIDALLRSEGVGVISMADDGDAYGIPMSFGYDGDDRLFMVFVESDVENRKDRFVASTTTASFLVYRAEAPHDWESVVVEGAIRRARPGEKEDAVDALQDNAWHPDLFSGSNPLRGFETYVVDVASKAGRRAEG